MQATQRQKIEELSRLYKELYGRDKAGVIGISEYVVHLTNSAFKDLCTDFASCRIKPKNKKSIPLSFVLNEVTYISLF